MRLAALLFLAGCFSLPACAALPEQFDGALESGAGVVGEIHGAQAELQLYVLSYRNPKDFFDFIEVSLIAENDSVAATLATLKRHDRVRIKGVLLENRSPQRHVKVASVEVVKTYAATPAMPAYPYAAGAPRDLLSKGSELFLVHSVAAGGQILVVEFRDIVLPIFVRNSSLTQKLARNDVVRLQYQVREEPGSPVHLQLNEKAERPVEVIESVLALHGKPAELEGALVMFPQSPQVRFNVFAVLQELPGGLQRQYTLANLDDRDVFTRIREKLQAAWDAAPAAVSGRNKLVSRALRVRVKGRYNEVDANQANVQILLSGPEAIEVTGVPQ